MFQTTQNDVFVNHTKLARFANHYSLYCGDRIGLGVEVYRNDGSIHLPVTPEMQVEILGDHRNRNKVYRAQSRSAGVADKDN